MIEIVKTYPVMLCLYKRLEFTAYRRRGWKGWKMITILSNNSSKRLGKHHQFNILWLVFVFHCSGNPDLAFCKCIAPSPTMSLRCIVCKCYYLLKNTLDELLLKLNVCEHMIRT